MRRIYGKRKWRRAAVVIMSSALLVSMPQTTAEAMEGVWDYGYTGGEQEFVAPYTGEYQMELYGAQGGNAVGEGGFEGGLGGKVQVTLFLMKGEKVSLAVGGQDGYNGGGTGTVSNGGGATDIRLQGNRVAIAGGGGGATKHAKGGDGGTAEAGNNDAAFTGASAPDIKGSAGGGGGCHGGTSGYYYVETATHTHGENCYTVCRGTVSYGDANGDGLSCGQCDTCGRNIEDRNQQPGMHPEPHPCNAKILICKEDTLPVKIPHEAVSFGGSNWYDSNVCIQGQSEGGVQRGNGACRVKLLKVFQLNFENTACKKVYYAGTEVKKIYYNGNLVYVE